MNGSAEASGPIQHNESEDDSDTDFDPEEIEKELQGVRSVLRRHWGRHEVLTKLINELEVKNALYIRQVLFIKLNNYLDFSNSRSCA